MKPIVNGLEEEFGPELDVRRLDAADPEVAALQASLEMRGHPALVILDREGRPVFRAFGLQPVESLRREIRTVLKP